MSKSQYGAKADDVAVVYPELAGRVAVVTGAAQGMGACFVAGLARQGVHVFSVDVNADALKATVDEINDTNARHHDSGGHVHAVTADVSSRDAVRAVATQAMGKYKRLDIWVNNAGLFPQSDIPSVTEEQLRRTFGVNVDGVFFGAQTAAEHMNDGGVIVNMASVAAVRVRPGRAVYSATKAAVQHLTSSLAVELGDAGIRVNALAPGFINTEMTRWVREIPGAMEKALATVPLGRIGQPSEVLGALLFLVSDSASYISGHTLAVDGGSRHG